MRQQPKIVRGVPTIGHLGERSGGVRAVSGSPMTSTTTWSILGPIIALTRIAIAFVGWSGAQVVGHGRSYVERAPVPCNVEAATGATGEAGYSLSAASPRRRS